MFTDETDHRVRVGLRRGAVRLPESGHRDVPRAAADAVHRELGALDDDLCAGSGTAPTVLLSAPAGVAVTNLGDRREFGDVTGAVGVEDHRQLGVRREPATGEVVDHPRRRLYADVVDHRGTAERALPGATTSVDGQPRPDAPAGVGPG